MALPLRIAVVGAGVAGLACALAAAQAGASVDVFEAADALSSVAAHVDVVPNLVRELARWGVVDDCVRLGFPYRRRLVLGQDGRQLLAIESVRLAGERYPAALGITHHALHGVLQNAAIAAGVRFHWSAPVRLIEEYGGIAVLHFETATPVRAELAVLACGVRTCLRQAVYGEVPALEEVGPAWRYLLAARPAGLNDALLAAGRGGRKAQVVPVSASQAGVQLRLPDEAPADDVEAVLHAFAEPVGTLVPASDRKPRTVTRPVRVGMLPDAWNRGPILAVGECAHALAPHFGQSAAMAAEDATVLGELLAGGLAPAPLIDAFVARRAPRALQVMQITLQAARWDLAPQPDMDLLGLWQQLTQVVAQPA